MSIPMPNEKWIQSTMKTLDLTRDEAIEMWCDDHDIDQGKAKDFDLDPEKQKVVKQMTKATRKPANYSLEGTKKRERKPNEEKREIINYLAHSLGECDKFDENFAQNVEIVNPEREITFKIGEKCYSLTLTLHRSPKK